MSASTHFKGHPARLPWAATAAALTAFAALAVTGGVPFALPLLGLGLLATYVVSARIEPGDWWVHWALRLALYSGVAVLNAGKTSEGLADSLWPGPVMDVVGQMMAAELVIQAWRRQPTRPPLLLSLILLSGITITAASQTLDPQYPRLFVPVYLAFLLLSLSSTPSGMSWRQVAAVAIAVGAGVGSYAAVQAERAALTDWGSHYLDGRPGPETTGLSQQPMLGETFGLRGSAQRVLRITGLQGVTYLCGATFDTYDDGRWGPSVDNRPYRLAAFSSRAAGTHANVVPLASTDGLLLIPLHCAGVDTGQMQDVQWSPGMGGPVRVPLPQPPPYTIIQDSDGIHPGPLALPPSLAERTTCLALPPDLDPCIRALAFQIIGHDREPRQDITKITQYLMQHHRYSLTFDPGTGDPVADFLLQTPPAAAHCEYFAASAALLLRCVGIPSRYVVGYLAHETDAPGVTVVRQRDAHAWAQAWVSGTGWLTVDATPPDGRPDQGIDTVPWWQRGEERLEDTAQVLRSWLLRQNWTQAGLGASGVALCVLIVQRLWRRRSPVSRETREYARSDAALDMLAVRFQTLLARQGIPCPPSRPWQEHLAQINRNHDATRDFVRAYNAARFGQAADSTAAELTRLLQEAEAEVTRAKETE